MPLRFGRGHEMLQSLPEEPPMVRKMTLATAAIFGLLIVASACVYAVSKPYQQDRILISLGLKSR